LKIHGVGKHEGNNRKKTVNEKGAQNSATLQTKRH